MRCTFACIVLPLTILNPMSPILCTNMLFNMLFPTALLRAVPTKLQDESHLHNVLCADDTNAVPSANCLMRGGLSGILQTFPHGS